MSTLYEPLTSTQTTTTVLPAHQVQYDFSELTRQHASHATTLAQLAHVDAESYQNSFPTSHGATNYDAPSSLNNQFYAPVHHHHHAQTNQNEGGAN